MVNAKGKKSAKIWHWTGWAVVSIRELPPDTKYDPCVSYPGNEMGTIFEKINACALPIFKTKREAENYKKTCRENFPNQYHRVTQVELTVNSIFTERERHEVDLELRRKQSSKK